MNTMKSGLLLLLLLISIIVCVQVTSSTSDELISRFKEQSYSDDPATKRTLLANGGWIEGSPPYSPIDIKCPHVGQINNIIVMVGNCFIDEFTKVILYDIDDNSFIQHDDISLSQYAAGQTYTQIATSLYMIDPNPSQNTPVINVYKLDTNQFIYNYFNQIIQYPADENSCLSHINDNYLIIAGGFIPTVWYNNVEIYSISQDIWLSNVPLMKQRRSQLSCITYRDEINHYFYVFGGLGTSSGPPNPLDSIEKLDVSDMLNIDETEWIEINDVLTERRWASRALIYDTNIYIIGGDNGPNGISGSDTVDVLHTRTDTVSMFDALIYETEHTGAILVNHKMYAFGGGPFTNEFGNKQWQFYDFGVPSVQPTENPTMEVSQCFIGSTCKRTADCCPGDIDEHVNGVKCQRKKIKSYHKKKSKDKKKKKGKRCCIKQGFNGCELTEHCCSGKNVICSENGICIKHKG